MGTGTDDIDEELARIKKRYRNTAASSVDEDPLSCDWKAYDAREAARDESRARELAKEYADAGAGTGRHAAGGEAGQGASGAGAASGASEENQAGRASAGEQAVSGQAPKTSARHAGVKEEIARAVRESAAWEGSSRETSPRESSARETSGRESSGRESAVQESASWDRAAQEGSVRDTQRTAAQLPREEAGSRAVEPKGEKLPGHEPVSGEIKNPEPVHTKKKSRAALIFLRTVEIIAVVVSFLASSRVARFFTAEATMYIVVEVTDRFGKKAGHWISTVFAAIVAEPRILALVVTGVILAVNVIVWTVRGIRRAIRNSRVPHGNQLSRP